jgi:hypothetical protein
MTTEENKPFPNCTELTTVLPMSIWWAGRIFGFVVTVWLMWFVYTAPDVGLTIFWGPAIPLLPLTFAVATVFGQPMTYTPPSTLVQLKMDGIVVKGFGISAPKSEDHELIESEHEPDNERRMLVAENGSIVGAVFVGPPGIGQHLNDAIQKNTDIILIKDALRAGNWEALAAE